MFRFERIGKALREAASIVIHFAHGGFLVTGLLVTVLIAAHLSGATSLEPVKQALAEVGRDAPDTQSPEAARSSSVPGMHGVVEYLSKRYRIAAVAVEPLIEAAQVAGEREGIDPLLIVAVMAIESRFNPIAESHVGARGLMQVIPRFHEDKIGTGTDHSVLLDPQTNILVGARVLKESIRRAGDLETGLQQYAGAVRDGDKRYSGRVIAERDRLEEAMRKARGLG
jgi:soluble lytic murein transglycosylase-like protein